MGGTSVTGNGTGSADTPIRPLQQLSKVVGLDGLNQFGVNNQKQIQNIKTFSNFTLEEQDSGKRFYDNRIIYTKTLKVDSFDTDSGYAFTPHGISVPFSLVESNGYVEGLYSTYANYKDDTYYYWFWTADGNYAATIILYYVKNDAPVVVAAPLSITPIAIPTWPRS